MEVYLSGKREIAQVAEVSNAFKIYRVNTSTAQTAAPTLTPSRNPAGARFLAAQVIYPEIPAAEVSVLTVPLLNPLVFVNYPQPRVSIKDLGANLQKLANRVSQEIESALQRQDLYSAIFWTSFAATATTNGTGISFYPLLMTSHELNAHSLALVTEAAKVVKETFGAVTCKLMDLIPQKNPAELNLAFFELAFDVDNSGVNAGELIELIESKFEQNVKNPFFESTLSHLKLIFLEEVAAQRTRVFACAPDKDDSKRSEPESRISDTLYGLCGIAGMYLPRPLPRVIEGHPELVSFYIFPYFAAKYLLHELQKVSSVGSFQITRPFAFEVPSDKASNLLDPKINMANPNFRLRWGTFFLNSLFFIASAENVPSTDWMELVLAPPHSDIFWGREESGHFAANVARVRLLKSFSQEVTPLPFISDLARSAAKFWANVNDQLRGLSQIKLAARHFSLTKPAGLEHTVDALLFFLDQGPKTTDFTVKNESREPLIPLEITGNLEIHLKFKLSDTGRVGPGFVLQAVKIIDNTNGFQTAAARLDAFLRYLQCVIVPNFAKSISPLATSIETPPFIGHRTDSDNFHFQSLIATAIMSAALNHRNRLGESGLILPKIRVDGGPAWFNPLIVTSLKDMSLDLKSTCETPEGYGLTVYFFHGIKFDPANRETYQTLVDSLNAFFDLAKRSGIFPNGVKVSYILEII